MYQSKYIRRASLLVAATAGIALLASTATAQMFEKPRQFRQQDRAGLAVFMKQLNDSRNPTVASGGDSTVLVCGGSGGAATATANSSCVILNNSDASTLGLGQGSEGDQGADSNVDTTTNTTTADEVSNILQQSNSTTTNK